MTVLAIEDIGGEVVKQDDRYTVKDNTTLKNLVVSSTWLIAGKCTNGHAHPGQEEVYYFTQGKGEIELITSNGERTRELVGPGSVVLIEDGVFHRVHNTGDFGLYFVCVFDGKRADKK
jgi:oxalate decarboxylase/phosphoglucose isomerase-like protein (cupin superfamily)|tara:strand:+ start:270 stop:623 length:354 start_codon:yes stop_codon:yes gene_type:complete